MKEFGVTPVCIPSKPGSDSKREVSFPRLFGRKYKAPLPRAPKSFVITVQAQDSSGKPKGVLHKPMGDVLGFPNEHDPMRKIPIKGWKESTDAALSNHSRGDLFHVGSLAILGDATLPHRKLLYVSAETSQELIADDLIALCLSIKEQIQSLLSGHNMGLLDCCSCHFQYHSHRRYFRFAAQIPRELSSLCRC
jgi:hypothetical protein